MSKYKCVNKRAQSTFVVVHNNLTFDAAGLCSIIKLFFGETPLLDDATSVKWYKSNLSWV